MASAAPGHGLFVGIATLDVGYLVERYPVEDSKNRADDQLIAAGGPASNAAVAYSFLAGGGARLITALGRHCLASIVLEELRQHGIRVHDLIPEHEAPPPLSSITVSRANGSRTIVSLDAARLPSVMDFPGDALLGCRVLLIDGHLMRLSIEAARAARAAGVPVVFDGGRWKEGNDQLLPHVDVAICSRLFSPPDLEHAAPRAIHQDLHDRGVPMVATTDGAAPILFSTLGVEGEITVPGAKAIDTLGAGDIYHGAFAYYYAHGGWQFPDALDSAVLVASAACEHFGTREWMSRGRDAFPR